MRSADLHQAAQVMSNDQENGTLSTASWSRLERETEVVLPAPVRHADAAKSGSGRCVVRLKKVELGSPITRQSQTVVCSTDIRRHGL